MQNPGFADEPFLESIEEKTPEGRIRTRLARRAQRIAGRLDLARLPTGRDIDVLARRRVLELDALRRLRRLEALFLSDTFFALLLYVIFVFFIFVFFTYYPGVRFYGRPFHWPVVAALLLAALLFPVFDIAGRNVRCLRLAWLVRHYGGQRVYESGLWRVILVRVLAFALAIALALIPIWLFYCIYYPAAYLHFHFLEVFGSRAAFHRYVHNFYAPDVRRLRSLYHHPRAPSVPPPSF